jgi:hypothetical protein
MGRANLVLLGFLAIAAFFLFTEHRAHVLGALPWLLLAACPLMHLRYAAATPRWIPRSGRHHEPRAHSGA